MGDLRLPKAEMLRADREYRELVRRGERASTMHYAVYRDFRAAAGQEGASAARKIGISAGRRIGTAVVRNRMKRLLREFYRQNRHAFPEGSRTAIVVRKNPAEPDLASVTAELLPAIERRWGGKGGQTPCGQETSR